MEDCYKRLNAQAGECYGRKNKNQRPAEILYAVAVHTDSFAGGYGYTGIYCQRKGRNISKRFCCGLYSDCGFSVFSQQGSDHERADLLCHSVWAGSESFAEGIYRALCFAG